MLNNLTFEYETLITIITQSIKVNGTNFIKLYDLFNNLINESKRIKNKQTQNDEMALLAEYKTSKSNKANNKSKKPKFNQQNKVKKAKNTLKCDHCHKKGHKIDTCWIKNPELKKGYVSATESQSNDSEMAMITVNNDFIERDLDVASDNEHYYNYSALTDINNTCFILDSGATSHICYNKSYFTNLTLTNIHVS